MIVAFSRPAGPGEGTGTERSPDTPLASISPPSNPRPGSPAALGNRTDAPAPGSTCPKCNGWAKREIERGVYACAHGHRWPIPR